MDFCFKSFMLRFKLSFNKYLILGLLVYLILFIFIVTIYSNNNNSKISIGFFYNNTKFANNVFNEYKNISKDTINPIRYNSSEDLKIAVEKEQVDCGFNIPDNYDGNGKIIIFTNNKSVTKSLNEIILSGIYLENKAGELGSEILSKYVKDKSKTQIANEINLKNKQYLERENSLKVAIENETPKNYDEKVNNINPIPYILLGINGVFILIIVFFISLSVKTDNSFKVISILKLHNKKLPFDYANGNILFFSLLTLLILISGIIPICFLYKLNVLSIHVLIGVIIYSMLIGNLIFYISFFKQGISSTIITIFYFAFSFLFSQIFFSFGGFLKYFSLSFYYFEIIKGNYILIFVILLQTIVFYFFNKFSISKV